MLSFILIICASAYESPTVCTQTPYATLKRCEFVGNQIIKLHNDISLYSRIKAKCIGVRN